MTTAHPNQAHPLADFRYDDAVRVGKRRLPGLRFPLGTFDHADWGTTSKVVRWLEADDVLAALGNPPSLSEPPQIPTREVATDGA